MKVAQTLAATVYDIRVSMTPDDRESLEVLDERLRTMLPLEYQDSYETMQPVSMGSTGLKFQSDGQVAWNDMWQSFCDLAMAGGPPHKGTLLEPGRREDIVAQPDRYADVAAEIRRGIRLVTGLPTEVSRIPGWLRVTCHNDVMADWLTRAIVMENVAAFRIGNILHLPLSPGFRLEKEIKNVITVIGKTCHYWMGHIPAVQKVRISMLFATMAVEGALIAPALPDAMLPSSDQEIARAQMSDALQAATGRPMSSHRYADWFGMDCADVAAAVWMMRALVASNVLARREGTTLCVPLHPIDSTGGGDGAEIVRRLSRIYRLAIVRQGATESGSV